MWRQARQLAEHAEATYLHDRAQALDADRRDLTRLRDRADVHDTNATDGTDATDARTRHTELHAEQRLREPCPTPTGPRTPATYPGAPARPVQKLQSAPLPSTPDSSTGLHRDFQPYVRQEVHRHVEGVSAHRVPR